MITLEVIDNESRGRGMVMALKCDTYLSWASNLFLSAIVGCSTESTMGPAPDFKRDRVDAERSAAEENAKITAEKPTAAPASKMEPAAPSTVTDATTKESPLAGIAGPWIDLLSDNSLRLWKMVPDESATEDWMLENGVLRCNTTKHGWLLLREEFADFELELDYRLIPKANSGIHYRYSGSGSVDQSAQELQIVEEATFSGTLNPMQRTGAVWNRVAPDDPKQNPVGKWNSIRLVCRGNLHQVTLNDKNIVDIRMSDPAIRDTGFIAISNWRGWANGCEFRNIRIRRLAK